MALPARHLPTPAPRPDRRPGAPHLAPVTGQHPKRGALALVVTAIVTLVAIFATQLWLSVAISEGAYVTNDLLFEERELARAERVKTQEVQLVSSPQHLATEAAEQGMVQNAQPAFLALATGNIEGELQQHSTSARENVIENAALEHYLTPESVRQAEAEKARKAAAAEAEATTEAETEKERETSPSGEAESSIPRGPVSWSGNLPAPTTH